MKKAAQTPKPVKAWAIVTKRGYHICYGKTRREAWSSYTNAYDEEIHQIRVSEAKEYEGYRCIRILITPA